MAAQKLLVSPVCPVEWGQGPRLRRPQPLNLDLIIFFISIGKCKRADLHSVGYGGEPALSTRCPPLSVQAVPGAPRSLGWACSQLPCSGQFQGWSSACSPVPAGGTPYISGNFWAFSTPGLGPGPRGHWPRPGADPIEAATSSGGPGGWGRWAGGGGRARCRDVGREAHDPQQLTEQRWAKVEV